MEAESVQCAHCPVERGAHCEGLNVRRLCELAAPERAAFNPEYVSLIRRLSAESSGGDMGDSTATGILFEPANGAEALGQVAERASSSGPGSLTVAESLALLAEMKQCPRRTVRDDCGCAGLAWCSACPDEPPRSVNHFDCFNCLRAGSSRIA